MDLSNSASANSFFKGISIVFFANGIDKSFGGINLKGANNPIEGNKANATRKSIGKSSRVNSMAVLFTTKWSIPSAFFNGSTRHVWNGITEATTKGNNNDIVIIGG